jgi:hypothetical protein
VVFVELGDLVDDDHTLPIVVEVLPASTNIQEEGRRGEGKEDLLCSVKSGANLLKVKVYEEGSSAFSICHPRVRLRVAWSCSKSLNRFQTLHLKTFSFST